MKAPGISTSPRRAAAALASALGCTAVLATPASALPPLTFDQPCYGEGMPITVTGSGFTPNGPIDLIGGAAGRIGSYELTADAAGALKARLNAPEASQFLAEDQRQADLVFAANDRTRVNDGGPPDADSEVAAGQFTLSRLGVDFLRPASLPYLRPGKRFAIDAYGWAHAADRALYLFYVRGDRVLKRTRLGVVRGPCGDLRKSFARFFPFRPVPAGRYDLIVGPIDAVTNDDAPFWRERFRVRRRDAIK